MVVVGQWLREEGIRETGRWVAEGEVGSEDRWIPASSQVGNVHPAIPGCRRIRWWSAAAEVVRWSSVLRTG